jgi:multiple sugar transport system permease protein
MTVDWGPVMAFATMVTLPMLVVFILFQNWFIDSITNSGLKG